MKRILKTATLILLLACLAPPAGALSWGVKELETEKMALQFARDVQKGGYGLVSTQELKGWIDAGKNILVVDTMPYKDSYRKNHIPGAVQFEFPIPEVADLPPAQRAAYEKLLGPDKNRPVVVYCGFTKCTRSHNGALWARKLGYTNVYRHPGGIKGWMEAGYPVEKGK